MTQNIQQLEAHIEDARQDLGSNLHELGQKVRSAADWKEHYRANPAAALGVAFGGGVVIAAIMGRKVKLSERTSSPPQARPRAATGPMRDEVARTWDTVKGALIGVAASSFKDFVGNVVPGFREQLHRGR